MARPRAIRGDHLRTALAQEAARIMAEQGISDYGFAKRKAAERLGAGEFAVLPKNTEIDLALAEYQRLFERDSHGQTLHEQREVALKVMALFAKFDPRLTGPVLAGSATAYQDIDLHVFSDSVEDLSIELLDRKIPFKLQEHRVRFNAERSEQVPALHFEWQGLGVMVRIFPKDGIRQAPLSALDGKPERRATRAEVVALMEEAEKPPTLLDAPWVNSDFRS